MIRIVPTKHGKPDNANRWTVDIEVRGIDPPDEVEIVTRHDRDEAHAPPETSRRREVVPSETAVVPPEDDSERLAIMTVDGELAEADARVMMRAAPT